MVDPRDILKFTDEIARRFQPRKIILFGSYAYGNPTWDSDVDLLVVMPHPGLAGYRKATQICLSVKRSFPCDMLVRSPSELRQRLEWNDFFMREIVEKGICLYDAANQGVGRQGRRRLSRRGIAPAIQEAMGT